MDGLQARPHGGREVRSYTANRRGLRIGVVAAEAASGCLLAMWRSSTFDPLPSVATGMSATSLWRSTELKF